MTASVLANTFQPSDVLLIVDGAPPGSWGYTLSSSSKTSKGPMGAPPRLRLLFEVRSRDGTPCSSLVRLGRQNNYLHCCGSGFCGRIGVGFPSSQRSTTSTYAIIDFPASNSWVELSAVLQCACSAAVDMTPQNPGDPDHPNANRTSVTTRSSTS